MAEGETRVLTNRFKRERFKHQAVFMENGKIGI